MFFEGNAVATFDADDTIDAQQPLPDTLQIFWPWHIERHPDRRLDADRRGMSADTHHAEIGIRDHIGDIVHQATTVVTNDPQ